MKKVKVLNYTVKIHRAEEGGFWATVPALPGCVTQGKTIEEIMSGIREAITLMIKVLAEKGQKIPIEKKNNNKQNKPFFIPVDISFPQLV